MRTLHFHFDFISPYAYFAWSWVREFCAEHDLELIPEPTILGVVLGHHGHLGPAEIPSKREFVFRDCLRHARRLEIELGFPALHPFNSVTALRLALPEVAGPDQLRVIDALWRATWVTGADVSTAEGLTAVLDAEGLDGEALVARTQDPEMKQALKAGMDRAIAAGVFGVPTFILDGELFWGNDQRESLTAYVRGDRGYDDDHLAKFLATPFGVRRQR